MRLQQKKIFFEHVLVEKVCSYIFFVKILLLSVFNISTLLLFFVFLFWGVGTSSSCTITIIIINHTPSWYMNQLPSQKLLYWSGLMPRIITSAYWSKPSLFLWGAHLWTIHTGHCASDSGRATEKIFTSK